MIPWTPYCLENGLIRGHLHGADVGLALGNPCHVCKLTIQLHVQVPNGLIREGPCGPVNGPVLEVILQCSTWNISAVPRYPYSPGSGMTQ